MYIDSDILSSRHDAPTVGSVVSQNHERKEARVLIYAWQDAGTFGWLYGV